MCNCPAFMHKKVKGFCKHIKQVKHEHCGWNWEAYCGTVGKPNNGNCPHCGEPVIPIKVGV